MKLLGPLEGPNWMTLLDEAPRLEPEPPATIGELMDLGMREVLAEGAWNERLCQRVRRGEIAIEAAVLAAAAHGSRRTHNARLREQKRWRQE